MWSSRMPPQMVAIFSPGFQEDGLFATLGPLGSHTQLSCPGNHYGPGWPLTQREACLPGSWPIQPLPASLGCQESQQRHFLALGVGKMRRWLAVPSTKWTSPAKTSKGRLFPPPPVWEKLAKAPALVFFGQAELRTQRSSLWEVPG